MNINTQNFILNFNKEADQLDNIGIAGEPYENYEHNNSRTFFHGLIDVKTESIEDEDEDEISSYMIFAYENEFKKTDVNNMTIISNINDKRNTKSIASKGAGLKHVLCKYSEEFYIFTITTDDYKKSIIKTSLICNLKNYIDILQKKRNLTNQQVENLLHTYTTKSSDISLSEYLRKNDIIKEIYQKMKSSIKTYNNNNNDDEEIKKPKSFIIIKLKEEYNDNTYIRDIYDSIKGMTRIRYGYAFKKCSYFMFKSKDENYELEKLETLDILKQSDKETAIKFYVKSFKVKEKSKTIKLIFYYKAGIKWKFYNYTSDGIGKLGEYNEITEDCFSDIYEKCKDFTDKDCDFSFEMYKISKNGLENLKSDLENASIDNALIDYAGFYYKFYKGNFIINQNPYTMKELFGGKYLERNYGGSRPRFIINIRNKEVLDLRGIKSETKITNIKTKGLLKLLFQKCWDSFFIKYWKDHSIECPKNILLSDFDNKFKSGQKKLKRNKAQGKNCASNDSKRRATVKTLYYNLHKNKEEQYVCKVGIAVNLVKANKRNIKNIGSLLSQYYILNMENSTAQLCETTIKNHWYNGKFEVVEKQGQITERIFTDLNDDKYRKINSNFTETNISYQIKENDEQFLSKLSKIWS